MNRYDCLTAWVGARFPGRPLTLAPASADASFRRYFRVSFADGAPSRIVMDAPPDKEDSRPFVHAAGLLAAAGINVPQVLDSDLAQGFLLLTDLGSTTYLDALRADPARAPALYHDAIAALIALQSGAAAATLPPYDRALLLREMRLLPEWYVGQHRKFELGAKDQAVLARAFDTLMDNIVEQPRAFVHRDYHSRNLMVTREDRGEGANPGVLDFQDAVSGPLTYDLVSLLKDAYVELEEERVLDWCIRYWEAARKVSLPVAADFGVFYRDFEWTGLQRHLKILGIFARLNYRDGKDQYLADLPLVLKYARSTCARYTAFTPLLRLLDRIEAVEVRTGHTF